MVVFIKVINAVDSELVSATVILVGVEIEVDEFSESSLSLVVADSWPEVEVDVDKELCSRKIETNLRCFI